MHKFKHLPKIQIDKLPSKTKSLIYLLQIPVVVILLNTKIFTESKFDFLNLFLILFGLIIGWQNINPYLIRVENSWSKTFKKGFFLYLYEMLFAGIVILITGNSNPMGIANTTISISTYLHTQLLLPPIVAFSEEFFKFLIFLAFISLIKLPKNIPIIISIILSSFIFGYMHVFHHTLTAGLPLAFSAIPSFIFLIKYKSIIPLIIAHFVLDTLAFISHIEIIGKNISGIIFSTIFLVWLMMLMYPIFRDIYSSIKYHFIKR